MKATEQYFDVVLFIMLYKVILTFESVDEILKCLTVPRLTLHRVISCDAVYQVEQGSFYFRVCRRNPVVSETVQINALQQYYFLVVLFDDNTFQNNTDKFSPLYKLRPRYSVRVSINSFQSFVRTFSEACQDWKVYTH